MEFSELEIGEPFAVTGMQSFVCKKVSSTRYVVHDGYTEDGVTFGDDETGIEPTAEIAHLSIPGLNYRFLKEIAH